MRIPLLYKIAVLALSAVLLSACGPGLAPSLIPSSLPQSPLTPSPEPSPTAIGTGLCANTLAPVKEGATWTYANTGGPVSPSTFTVTITEVRPDGFTDSFKVDDSVAVDQRWACQPNGLLAQSLGVGQGALALSSQGFKADLDTSNPTGVTLPANVQPGMKWNYGLGLAGSLEDGGLSGQATGSVSTDMQAIGMESVTVPAGTFNAMKVQSVSTFSVSAASQGFSIPITAVLNSTFWFAPNVGWVKSTVSGDFAGTSLNTVTELQSFNIP